MNTALHFSSASDDWSTPQDFFDKTNAEFGPFELDVCATSENTKCPSWASVDGLYVDGAGHFSGDGLTSAWCLIGKRCWMNPPYGKTIGLWVKKAFEESKNGCTVVCLLPARTDTKWFHDYCIKGEIRFLKGRLKFGGAKNAAPFPSMIVIFRPS